MKQDLPIQKLTLLPCISPVLTTSLPVLAAPPPEMQFLILSFCSVHDKIVGILPGDCQSPNLCHNVALSESSPDPIPSELLRTRDHQPFSQFCPKALRQSVGPGSPVREVQQVPHLLLDCICLVLKSVEKSTSFSKYQFAGNRRPLRPSSPGLLGPV